MARKRKHPPPTQETPSPPALAAAMPAAKHALTADFDSDSPLGSPDSCSSRSGASSACSPSSSSGAGASCSGPGGGKAEKPPMVRSAANARERSRMRVLSKAFSRLKTTLPWVPADTKLSKLDTLRLASCYIAHLREILADDKPAPAADTPPAGTAINKAAGAAGTGAKKASGAPAPIHPLSLTWPFTFNGRVSLTSSSFNSDVISSRQKDSLHHTTTKTPIAGST